MRMASWVQRIASTAGSTTPCTTSTCQLSSPYKWIFVFRIFIRNNRRERKYCGLWVENFCQIKRIIDLHKLPYYIVLDVHSSIVSNMEFIVHSWQRYTYKESPRGAASGLSRCNFFRLQTSLLSLFLVQRFYYIGV